MGIAKNTTPAPKARQRPASIFPSMTITAFDLLERERQRERTDPKRARANRIKAKARAIKEEESKEVADRLDLRATVPVAPYIVGSRPCHQRSDAWCLHTVDPVDST